MAERTVGNGKSFQIGNIVEVSTALMWIILAGALAWSFFPLQAQTLVQNRIAAPIRSAQMQTMRGTISPKVARATDQGQLSGSTAIHVMSLAFRRSAAQEADLKQLLQQQQTPGSSLYHQWLKPGQFAARYGMSAADLTKAAAWLQSQGFIIDAIPPSNDRIDFSGTATQVNAAFHTELHRFSLHGETHWANVTEISLPSAIAGMAFGIEHLNTFRPRPHVIQRQVQVSAGPVSPGARPSYTFACSGQGCPASGYANLIAPADSQTIYDVTGLYNNNITGSGQTMAVVGQTDIVKYESDIASFRTLSGLNASNLPKQIVVPNTGTAAVSAGDLAEADIDTEWSGAVAKDATILYVTVGGGPNNSGGVFTSLQYAIQNPLLNSNTQFVPVISISYGSCEDGLAGSQALQQIESVLEQANAQGQTVVASSGDSGSAGCDGNNSKPAQSGLWVDYPASSQYVTAAGGTSFSGDLTDQSKYWNQSNATNNGSAISYIPETTWNDTPNQAGLSSSGELSASGGGASSIFSKPSWQAGMNVPTDGMRDVPDVSLAADPNHDGYVLCTEQTNISGSNTIVSGGSTCPANSLYPYFFSTNNGYSTYIYGGTSIAAPQLAAMITLWNQEAGNTTGVGNANPIFYLAAQNTPGAFHDVTTGSNAVVCQQNSPNCVSGSSGYVMSCCSAGSGYDEATGLGSVDAMAMGASWPTVSVTTTNPPQSQPTFTLLLNPSSISVSPSGSVTTSVVLDPSGAGSNSPGFSGTVNLACSGLPTGVTCNFASSSVALTAGTSQTVILTVSASSSAAATSVASRSSRPLNSRWPMQTAFAGVLGLFLLGAGRKRRLLRSPWMTVLLLAAGLVTATVLTACGSSAPASSGTTGNNSNPTPVSQKVTVTGTSGATTASAQIELTVT